MTAEPMVRALILAAVVAPTVLGFVLHILFSPWLLVAEQMTEPVTPSR